MSKSRRRCHAGNQSVERRNCARRNRPYSGMLGFDPRRTGSWLRPGFDDRTRPESSGHSTEDPHFTRGDQRVWVNPPKATRNCCIATLSDGSVADYLIVFPRPFLTILMTGSPLRESSWICPSFSPLSPNADPSSNVASFTLGAPLELIRRKRTVSG